MHHSLYPTAAENADQIGTTKDVSLCHTMQLHDATVSVPDSTALCTSQQHYHSAPLAVAL